jgi:hypothetical protein
MNWLHEGDSNSKYFHGVMSNRWCQNDIDVVYVNGVSVEGVHNIRATVYNHYSTHFKSIGVARPGVEGLQFRKLSYVEAGNLTKPFSLAEVKHAVWDCDNYKSPGPDGIIFGFIKYLRDLL